MRASFDVSNRPGYRVPRFLLETCRLAALVLATVIDYNLHLSEARRADIDSCGRDATLPRQASDAIALRSRRAGLARRAVTTSNDRSSVVRKWRGQSQSRGGGEAANKYRLQSASEWFCSSEVTL